MLIEIDGTRLVVNNKSKATYKCDCGDESEYLVTVVKNNRRTMCKSCTSVYQSDKKRIDHSGKKYGEWTAYRFNAEATKCKSNRSSVWDCYCSCGVMQSINIADAISGKSTKCLTCSHKELAERKKSISYFGDGASYKHRIYRIWKNMKIRASSKTNTKFYEGVYMCREWNDFSIFREWAIDNGYKDSLELDKDMLCDHNRISPKKYSPETCLWVEKIDNIKYALIKDLVVKEELRRKYVLV